MVDSYVAKGALLHPHQFSTSQTVMSLRRNHSQLCTYKIRYGLATSLKA
jgi:hypothetical protein